MTTTNAAGRVTRLYPSDNDRTYIKLELPEDTPTEDRPLNGYFRLNKSHSNYNALYSLALVAAVNGYRLSIKTSNEIGPTEHGVVRYMILDW